MGIQLSRFKGMRRIFPFVSDSMPFHSPLVFCIAELFRILFGVNQIFTIAAKKNIAYATLLPRDSGDEIFLFFTYFIADFFSIFFGENEKFPINRCKFVLYATENGLSCV
jgi:hypothetical protein